MTGDVPATHSGPGRRELGSADLIDMSLPVLAFLVLNRFAGLGWAIAGATAASVRAAVRRRRRGLPLGWYLPVVTAYLIVRGVVSILFDSAAVYFGIGIATKTLIGLGLVASILIRRPAVTELAPLVFPLEERVRTHPIYLRTTLRLTWVAAAFELASSAWDVWLYNNASLNQFVIVRFLAGWVAGFVTVFTSILWAHVQLSRIPGFPGLLALFDPSLVDDEVAADEDADDHDVEAEDPRVDGDAEHRAIERPRAADDAGGDDTADP